MMFRIVLFVLLTIGLNVAAIAHCRVGGMSAQGAGAGENQTGTHDHQSDCGKPEKRICDAMVQMTAPDQPSVGPALDKGVFAPVALAPLIVTTPLLPALSLRQWRPPPSGRSSPFKATHARTGRLLV